MPRALSVVGGRRGFLGAMGGGIDVGLIGNHQPEHGFFEIAEAAGVPAVVCGGGDEELGAGSRAAAMEHGDAVAVFEAGVVKDGDERLQLAGGEIGAGIANIDKYAAMFLPSALASNPAQVGKALFPVDVAVSANSHELADVDDLEFGGHFRRSDCD